MLRSFALAAGLAIVGLVPSHASTLSGTLSGTFSAPTGSTASSIAYTGVGTDTLNWGTSSGGTNVVDPNDSAFLSVTGGTFDLSGMPPQDVLLGSITWVNHSNWSAGGIWSSQLSLSISLNTSSGVVDWTVPLNFTVENTPDLTGDTNHNETTGNVADIISGFSLGTSALDLPLRLGPGHELTDIFLQLDDAGTPGTAWSSNYGLSHFGQASGSTYDAATGIWRNREGGTSVIGIYGSIAPVPLPAGVWMMLAGLGALLTTKRMRSASA